jgi:hypothetical protein
MEACVGAHHLSRKLQEFGHDARLMPAKYVRPYSKGQKNDLRDAEAIANKLARMAWAVLNKEKNFEVVKPVLSVLLRRGVLPAPTAARPSMTNWRNRMGAERLQALLQESLAVATRSEAIKPSDPARAVVDTTVQPKNVTFPTDAKLVNRAREKLVALAKKLGSPMCCVS